MSKQELSERISLNQALRKEAIRDLKDYLNIDDTVYVILRHKSKTGMTRYISLYAVVVYKPICISYLATQATDETYSAKHDAMVVKGCGFDVGHHAAMGLSYALFGFANAIRHQWL